MRLLRSAVRHAVRRLQSRDFAAVEIVFGWLCSRAAIGVFAVGYAFVAIPGWQATAHDGFTLFFHWDSGNFRTIAEQWYFGPRTAASKCCLQAFFPGYPLALRAVHPIARSYELAGFLITLVAGVIAVIALWLTTRYEFAARGLFASTSVLPPVPGLVLAPAEGRAPGPAPLRDLVGRRAVTYLAVAPMTIFLSAAYSEALFLACALTAWVLARRGSWWWAALATSLAVATRVNGLFLLVGIAAIYVLASRRDGRRLLRVEVLNLAVPLLPALAFGWYLHAKTGNWTSWVDAERRGWHRSFAWPWTGWSNSWHLLQSTPPGHPDVVLSRYEEFGAVVVGVVLVVALVVVRMWAEAIYVGVSLAALTFSADFYSVPRSALLWFPGFTLVAIVTAKPRWRWLHPPIMAASIALSALAAVVFVSGGWVS